MPAFSITCSQLRVSEVFFTMNSLFFWVLDSYKYIFLIIKINNFPGYLGDISAESASLLHVAHAPKDIETKKNNKYR